MKLLCFILSLFICFGSHAAQSQTVQQTETDATLNAVWFVDNNIGWAVGDRGTILQTQNGGETWTLQQPRTRDHLYSIHFFDEFTGWIAGQDNLILYTNNGGNTWSEQRPSPVSGQDLTTLHFFDWKRGLAAGGPGGGVFFTENTGTTWSRRASFGNTVSVQTITFQKDQQGWAAYNNTIHLTDDRGRNWSEAIHFTDKEDYRVGNLHFLNSTKGWAIGAVGSDGMVLQTVDGGKEWRVQDNLPGQIPLAIHFYSENLGQIITANGSRLITRDGGISWETKIPGTSNAINDAHFSADGTSWAAGEAGTILKYAPPEFDDLEVTSEIYPMVEIADEDEAVDLLNRALRYAEGAEKRDNIASRKPHYVRLRGAVDNVEQYYRGREIPGYISERVNLLITHYWALEHNTGAEIFNRTAEVLPDSLHLMQKARDHFGNATVIQPDSTVSYLSLATAHDQLDDLTGAIRAMETGIERLEPPEVKHYDYLFTLYERKGRRSDALRIAEKASDRYPNSPIFLQYLTDLNIEAGETDKSLEYLDRLIDLDPDDPDYRFVRGSQTFLLGHEYLSRALERYEVVWRLTERQQRPLPENEMRDLEAQIQSVTREIERLEREADLYIGQAIRDLKRIIELRTNDDTAHGYLGMIHYNRAAILEEIRLLTADFEEAQAIEEKINRELMQAKEQYEKAADLNSSNREYWETLYQIYLFLGMYSDAERVSNRF